MNYLLDTHTLIWFLKEDKNLSTNSLICQSITNHLTIISKDEIFKSYSTNVLW